MPLELTKSLSGALCFPRSVDSDKGDRCVKSKLPKTKVSTGSTQLGKRERPASEKPPPAKKMRPNFKVGDCINLHDSKLGKCHLPCCIAQISGDRCLLCCCKGVLATGYAKRPISGDVSISIENW